LLYEVDVLREAIEAAKRIAETTVRRNAVRVDAESHWPEENIRELQAAGLGGLVLPVDVGGKGGGLVSVALVCEALGRECASTAICFGMHLVGSAVLGAKATRAQRERYLEPMARGHHLTSLALSEAGTGTHFYLPEVTMARREGELVINGRKDFVTSGGFADSYVLSVAPADTTADAGEFSCLVVDAETPGLRWSDGWRGWGMRGNASRSVDIQSARVPADRLLGEPGDEIWYVFNVIAPFFLVAMAGVYLGAAAAALEVARTHTLQRRHSHTGTLIAENALVQHRLGEMWSAVQRTRSLIYDACRLGDAGDSLALPALCSAKAEVAEAAERVASDAMTLVGGRGYVDGHVLPRLYRDIRAAHIMAPTTDLLRVWTGRAVLGLPILGD
jgi:alkylation response protein AidB-like acyl-CoA dehydrogenase